MSMRSGSEWAALRLADGVRLILGWRDEQGALVGQPVELKDEIAADMRDACVATLANLGLRAAKRYSELGNIESDEFLSLEIRKPPDHEDEDLSPELEELLGAADIVGLAMGAFAATDFLTRDELFEGGWLYYAVVVEVEGESNPVAFVRQYNPQRGFGAGRLLSFYSDALARAEDPVFIFDLAFDVVVAEDEIAIIGPTAFQRIFADVGVVAAEVPSDVSNLVGALSVPIDAAGAVALTAYCQEKHRLAARLKKLARQPHQFVTKQTLVAALTKHGLPADRFGPGNTITLTDLADVRELLDVLEKRYYEETSLVTRCAQTTPRHVRAKRTCLQD
jgi:hypothetical protein